MTSNSLFLSISVKYWWTLIILGKLILVINLSLSLSNSLWVFTLNNATIYSQSTSHLYNGTSFTGSLYGHSLHSYKYLSRAWCSSTENEHSSISDKTSRQSICSMYSSLYKGMIIFTVFESLSLFFGLAFFLTLFFYYKKKTRILLVTSCMSGLMWLSHYLASLIYINITNTNFTKACDVFPANGSSPSLCAGTGLKLSFAALGLFPVVCIFFCVFSWQMHRVPVEHSFNKSTLETVKDITTEKNNTPLPNTIKLSKTKLEEMW